MLTLVLNAAHSAGKSWVKAEKLKSVLKFLSVMLILVGGTERPHTAGGAALSQNKQSEWTPDQARGDNTFVVPGLTRNPFLFDKRPHTAGGAALSQNKQSEWTPDQVRGDTPSSFRA